MSSGETQLDVLPFASRSQRGTEDTTLVMLGKISKPLQQPKSLARVLFIYFSSALNTIKVDNLLELLFALNLNDGLIGGIRSFLNWPTSESFFERDSLRQPCFKYNKPLLSPLLFSIYTNEMTINSSNVKVV